MHLLKTIASVLVFLQLASCATSALWQRTDPAEYLAISYDDISEQELKQRGTAYYKHDEERRYYVEKRDEDKFKDKVIRTLGTPVTVVVDTAIVVLVVGLIVTNPGSFLNDIMRTRHSDQKDKQQ